MDFLHAYGKELFSLVATGLIAVGKAIFKPRARLTFGFPHSFTYLIQQPLLDASGNEIRPNQTVQIANILIRNEGRKSAQNVEIVFNWEPLCLNVWPQRVMNTLTQPDGRHIIKLPNLAPKEVLHCNILSLNTALPDLINVRSDSCEAYKVEYTIYPAVSKTRLRIVLGLMFLGVAATIFLILNLAQFVLHFIPSAPK